VTGSGSLDISYGTAPGTKTKTSTGTVKITVRNSVAIDWFAEAQKQFAIPGNLGIVWGGDPTVDPGNVQTSYESLKGVTADGHLWVGVNGGGAGATNNNLLVWSIAGGTKFIYARIAVEPWLFSAPTGGGQAIFDESSVIGGALVLIDGTVLSGGQDVNGAGLYTGFTGSNPHSGLTVDRVRNTGGYGQNVVLFANDREDPAPGELDVCLSIRGTTANMYAKPKGSRSWEQVTTVADRAGYASIGTAQLVGLLVTSGHTSGPAVTTDARAYLIGYRSSTTLDPLT
jgi:hypothetical protein